MGGVYGVFLVLGLIGLVANVALGLHRREGAVKMLDDCRWPGLLIFGALHTIVPAAHVVWTAVLVAILARTLWKMLTWRRK